MLYGVVRATLGSWLTSEPEVATAREQNAGDLTWSWVDPSHSAVSTVFTPVPIFAAQNLSVPEVREGLKLTQRALLEIKQLADQHGSELLVVLIPTKEEVYCPVLANRRAKLPLTHEKVCRSERKLNEELTRFSNENQLALIDAAPALVKQVERGAPVYLPSRDGHMVPEGNALLARIVSDGVSSLLARSGKR
jgi:hypothetical protein